MITKIIRVTLGTTTAASGIGFFSYGELLPMFLGAIILLCSSCMAGIEHLLPVRWKQWVQHTTVATVAIFKTVSWSAIITALVGGFIFISGDMFFGSVIILCGLLVWLQYKNRHLHVAYRIQ